MSEYLIRMPGRFNRQLVFIDLETEKVSTPSDYRMPSGEPLRRRWSTTLAAAAFDDQLLLFDAEGDEVALLDELSACCVNAPAVIYGATRQFDEMVLRGRFTNARRAHLTEPTWPAMPGAENVNWVNVGPATQKFERDADVTSRDVPTVLRSGLPGDWERCAIHCLRDVVELVLAFGDPDAKCAAWCSAFLADYALALDILLSER